MKKFSVCLVSAIALAASGGVAAAQEAFGVAGPAATNLPQAFVPPSKQWGVGVPAAVPAVTLPFLDAKQLLAVDRLEALGGENGKRLRIGVGRAIDFDPALGVWLNDGAGGRIWVLDIVSPGAVGVRVHLTNMNLPEGAEVSVYNPADLFQAAGHYTGQGNFGTGEQYAPTLFGERVRVEYRVPKQEAGAAAALPFSINSIQHIYVDPVKAEVGPNGELIPVEGNCHNDVTCSAPWADVARATGRYEAVDGGSSFLCTGELIATQNNDLTPYFLTASHCVSTNAVANTVQVYWLYQTSTCNGAVPSLASVPQTNGAALIATRGQADSTLLRLTGSLPGGLFWVGWTANPIANGTGVGCVHHPDGAYKRLTLGTANDASGSCAAGSGQVASESVRAFWTSAVTEGGSSGGGLYRTDTKQLIGVLSCGPSFCGAPAGSLNDTFGRFASFYPTIASFLAAGADDTLEENDSCAAARAIGSGTVTNNSLVIKLTDEDWYRFTLNNNQNLNAQLSFTSGALVQCELYTVCGGAVVASSSSTATTRTISYTNTSGAADEVYLRVYLTGTTTTQNYNMTSTISTPPTPPANDLCFAATAVGTGAFNGTTVNAAVDGAAGCVTTQRADVWYRHTAAGTGTLAVNTCGSTTDTVVSIHTACPGAAGNQVACSDDAAAGVGPCGSSTNRTSYATRSVTAGQVSYIRVAMWGGTPGAFTLNVGFTATGVANDTCAAAEAIAPGATTVPFNTALAVTESGGQTDAACNFFSYNGIAKDVWYSWTAPANGNLTVDTCGSSYDTKLAVYAGCPTAADQALACDDDASPPCSQNNLHSRITSVPVTANTSYLVRVGGYRSTSGAETSGSGVLNLMFEAVTPTCGPADMGTTGGTPGGDGVLDNNDFVVFIDYFFSGNPAADLGTTGGTQGSDGIYDNNDFVVFIDLFFATPCGG